MSTMVHGYVIRFYENGKHIGTIHMAAQSKLQAEMAGRRMAAKGVTISVVREGSE
jgi:hypothetical protein